MSVIPFTPSLIDDEISFSLSSYREIYIGNKGQTARYIGSFGGYNCYALTNRTIKFYEVFRVAVDDGVNDDKFNPKFQMGLTKANNAGNGINKEDMCCYMEIDYMEIERGLIKFYKNDQVINERCFPSPLSHKEGTLYSIYQRDNGTVHFEMQGFELGEVQLDDAEEMFVFCGLNPQTKVVSIFKI